ncbi:hypothetical protein BGY98DRAFT_974550 [Russula aff. rugulosa BPL654]|nr:hypothetical protein BGY98DRAFT_974550 [Russula aff. rugulosa BPL654]
MRAARSKSHLSHSTHIVHDGLASFPPGKRKNRREDHVIQAIPISDAGHLLHEEDTDPEHPHNTILNRSTNGHGLLEPNLNIDYGRFQEGVAHSPELPPPHHRSVSRSHSRHHRGSRPSSTVPDITIHVGWGHMRSGSPTLPPRVSADMPGEHASRLIARNPDSLEHPDFQYSKCTGRKKAVCIGINYTGQNSQLDGCVSDAKNMYRFLMDRLGFRSRDIIRLTDDARDPVIYPQDSGHGSRVRDLNGDEVDGYDEVIFPLDYAQAGTIIDDELHDYLVKPLPSGCRLTVRRVSSHAPDIG